MKMTSAYANKMLRKLAEDKEYWRKLECEGCTYIAAVDEEPAIPDYDYSMVSSEITTIDEKVMHIKHAVNLNNAINQIQVGQSLMTVDQILVRMAQLNNRKAILDQMRKHSPKMRIGSGAYSTRKSAPEYEYINYDLALVKEEYNKVDAEIAAMQIALDKYNQTFEFEVQN